MRGNQDGNSLEALVKKAQVELKALNADNAVSFLEEALSIDCDDKETLDALRCVHWWREKFAGLEGISKEYDRGYFIMGQWGAYYDFLESLGAGYDRCRYAVRHFVYGTALEAFRSVLEEGMRHDPGLLLRIGRCLKGIGDYEKSLDYIQKAAHFMQSSGAAIADLADVNALLGEHKTAKVLFREAFFIDPQGVDLYSLESGLITSLISKVRNAGVSGSAFSEWLPVYGSLLGIFSVRRELKLVELGKLNQAVFSLENEVRTNSETKALSVPRLLNKYLWLLDHYENVSGEGAKINEILIKIKLIDPKIYERYMGIK